MEIDTNEDQPRANSPVQPVHGLDDIPMLEHSVLPADETVAALPEAYRDRSDSPEDFSSAMNFDVDPYPEPDLGSAVDKDPHPADDTPVLDDPEVATSSMDVGSDSRSGNQAIEVS